MLHYAILGANTGPRLSTLKRAIGSLADSDETLCVQGVSCAWEGQDGHLPHAPFINVAIAFTSGRGTESLRHLAKRVETEHGRQRDDRRNAPVALDIDLVLSEDATSINELTRSNLLVAYCAVPLYDVATPRLAAWLMCHIRERESNWESLRSRLWMVAEPEDVFTEIGRGSAQHPIDAPNARAAYR